MAWYLSAVLYVWGLFKLWIDTLLVIPIKNGDMLWILVPVWISWFFSEFFQEKIGTSMGNAITNAVVVLWGSIDCARQTVHLITNKIITSTLEIIARFTLISIIFIYGSLIIVLGIKGRNVIKKIGRVRTVTYVFAMFVPIFYNDITFSVNHIIATVMFFPLFYFVIELIDKITPDPKALIQDMQKEERTAQPKPTHAAIPPTHYPSSHYQSQYRYNPHQRYNQYPAPHAGNNQLNKK